MKITNTIKEKGRKKKDDWKRYEETIGSKVLVYGCIVSVTQKEYLMMMIMIV